MWKQHFVRERFRRGRRTHPDGAFRGIWLATFVLASTLCGRAVADTPTRAPTVDQVFGVPIPPVDAYYAQTATLNVSWALFVIGMIVVCFALIDALKTKSILPVAVAVSGTGCVISEAYCGVMGAVFWPTNLDNFAFTALGRQMSWYPVAAWFAFGAVSMYIYYALISRNPRTIWLWGAFALVCLADIVFEEVMLNIRGLYLYYANQPLILLTRFPWWWGPVNAGGLFLPAALAHRFNGSLRGWRSLAVLVLTPLAYQAFIGFAAMPAFIVINGDYSWVQTQAGGLLAIVLAVVATALTMKLVLHRDPFDFRGATAASSTNCEGVVNRGF